MYRCIKDKIARLFSHYLHIDIYRLFYVKHYPKFFADLRSWKRQGGKVTRMRPVLDNFYSEAGVYERDYFHQDLLVAQSIYERKPKRHVDFGSKIEGLVAHVASFRKIEVFDIRSLSINEHPNIVFVQKKT